jgi:hypothetical protein
MAVQESYQPSKIQIARRDTRRATADGAWSLPSVERLAACTFISKEGG